MGELFAKPSVKKIAVSTVTGFAMLLITWCYLNSYYTLGVEDDLFKKEVFLKDKWLNIKPKHNQQFVFISTGKDLALVNDNAGTGNIVVSNRAKVLKLLQAINAAPVKPKFILLDLQFYYPYIYTTDDSLRRKINTSNLKDIFPDKSIDSAMQVELAKMKNSAISVLLDGDKIDTPIYKASYGIADYKTYGSGINKFKINYTDQKAASMPALMHEQIDGAKYSGGDYTAKCNGHLCFNFVWPSYYYDEESLKKDSTQQYYHIGTLTDMPGSDAVVSAIIPGKIVCVGNFEGDVHNTPRGSVFGTLILANIYLSLLNNEHFVPWLWLVFLWFVFSILSYIAIYNKLPDVKFNARLLIMRHASSFLNKYISFFGVLLLTSVISVLLFNMMVSLFLPATIFSAIDYLIKRKYKLE